MGKLLVRCVYVNRDKNSRYSEDPDYVEAFTDSRGRLFLDCQREYGRCVSTMRDERDGDRPCGWVFEKRERYSGRGGRRPETYLRETWVHLREVRGEGVEL